MIEIIHGKSDLYVKRQKLQILEEEIIEAATVKKYTDLTTAVHNAYKNYCFEKLKNAGYSITIIKEGSQVTDFKISW